MHISNYNSATGTFEIRFTDYYQNKTSPQATATYSSAAPNPFVVIDNTDRCINPSGSVRNVSQSSVNVSPTFGCSFTKNIALNFTGTENVTVATGSYPFTNVYTGQTTPGSGVPYIHFINYSAYNNIYTYVHN